MLTKKHLVPVVVLIIVTIDSMGNWVRLTSSFPSSDLGKITSFNFFILSFDNDMFLSVFLAVYFTLYPILIVVHTLWSFHRLAPLNRHEAGKEFVSCTDLTKIDKNNFKTSI